ncbi:MAG: CRTAC1 family protein [Acidobacteriaceae bacterium]
MVTRRQFLGTSALLASGRLLGAPLLGQALSSAKANPWNVQFADVTAASGIKFVHERAASPEKLVVETMGPGCAWLDYNQDGFLDAFFVNSGRTPDFHPVTMPQPALYRNNGDGTFTDVTAQSGIRVADGFYMGVAVGDFDNDGFPDIYMTGYGRSLLFRNNGNGTFTDVTAVAGVENPGRWATAAAWFDYDHDGHLDLLVTNYIDYDWNHDPYCGAQKPGYRVYCDPFHFHGTSMRLYRNNGDGTFSDRTEKAGLLNPDGKSLGVVIADFDGDGWDDILIANDGMRSFLYCNNRDGTFRDATWGSGAAFGANGEVESGMGLDAADATGKGRMDFFICHMDNQPNRFYENNGDGTFTDRTMSCGLGFTGIHNTSYAARFVDWDNDGNRDLIVVNGSMLDNINLYHPASTYAESKMLYRNLGKAQFVDATDTQSETFSIPRVGRGLATGDYNNDGAVDFLESNNGQAAQLYRNSGSPGNHWIGLRLVGTRSNRDAVGAQVHLHAEEFSSFDQVRGGGGYCSSHDPRLFFGLGAHARVEKLEIRWPSGAVETLDNLAADRILTIREGAGVLPYRFPQFRSAR